jgi:hypothetical protein
MTIQPIFYFCLLYYSHRLQLPWNLVLLLPSYISYFTKRASILALNNLIFLEGLSPTNFGRQDFLKPRVSPRRIIFLQGIAYVFCKFLHMNVQTFVISMDWKPCEASFCCFQCQKFLSSILMYLSRLATLSFAFCTADGALS